MNDFQHEILNKIENAVINPAIMPIADERRVACILYDLIKREARRTDLGDLDKMIEDLPPKYSESTKDRIHQILYVVELLTHCDEP